MADGVHRNAQYAYAANSNLVINQERGSLPRRDHEASGEPESLAGRITHRFGDRALAKRKEKDTDKDKEKQKEKDKDKIAKKQRRGVSAAGELALALGGGSSSVLAATAGLDVEAAYRPRTKDTRSAYALLLALLGSLMGGGALPTDVLHGAAFDALVSVHDQSLKDVDRKRDIEDILGAKISSEAFAQLVSIAKKLTDFNPSDNDGSGQDNLVADARAADIDQDYGVAVVFDEDEDDEEADGSDNEYEVDNENDDDEDEDGENRQNLGPTLASADSANKSADSDDEDVDMDNDDGIVIKQASKSSSKAVSAAAAAAASSKAVNPHDIDAFWLQRQVALVYSDPHIVQEKAQHALEIMSSKSKSARDIENNLMALFDYDKFDLVKLLTRNNDLIVWCTRYARAAAGTDEKHAIEEEMRDAGVEYILNLLSQAPARKLEGRSRRGVVEGAMEIDESGNTTSRGGAVGDKSQDASGSAFKAVAQPGKVPKNTIDLDEMTFLAGGHLMSNKKCKLPEGSWKKTKKGYEEVHVPAPKPKGLDPGEKLIEIKSMPEWTHEAFKNSKSLNRIQSKVYPVAFKDDVNMLLCAPTGAGKTNCAMLTILREIGKYRDERTGQIDLDSFKIVYIAPMKALVAEMVGNFGERLKPYGITVAELTGDR
ncbi:DEIH-box ATPase, partial [Physocladia obscura]